MKKRSVEEQFAQLRPTTGFAAQLHVWFLGIAFLGLMASWLFSNPIPLMFSVFFGVVGVAERQTGSFIVAAISAYDSEPPVEGQAIITLTGGDMSDHYHVKLRIEGSPDWTYEFIPQGWQPKEGSYSAHIWQDKKSNVPVLAVIDEGMMIPRYAPQVGTG